jgi:hypothetical protein
VSEPQTEYGFTLPVGLVDAEGTHHREGSMRLATARDEIEPLRDARVRENGAYLSVLKLARVLTNVGAIQPVTPTHVEQLYASDFAHLKRLYEQINSASAGPSTQPAAAAGVPIPAAASGTPVPAAASGTPVPAAASGAPIPAAAPRPPALAGVSDTALDWMLDDALPAGPGEPEAVPIGVLQDRERAASREALMRSATVPRRGRVHEGIGPRTEALGPHADPPLVGAASAEPLMRLSSQPPATSPPPRSVERAIGTGGPAHGGVDMEEVYEEMIVRLRRELLVERERMGAPFGA